MLGVLIESVEYQKKGGHVLTRITTWDKSQRPIRETILRDGIRHGTVTYWDSHQNVRRIENYRNGVLVSTVPHPEVAAIRMSFDRFVRAFLARGNIARHVDRESITYYRQIMHLVQTAGQTEIEATRLVDQMLIIRIRHELGAAALRMSEVDIINKGLVPPLLEPTPKLGIDNVSRSGDQASGRLVRDGKVTMEACRFTKEAGVWRVNLPSLFRASEPALQELVAWKGISTTLFIRHAVYAVTNRQVPMAVWNKPAAARP